MLNFSRYPWLRTRKRFIVYIALLLLLPTFIFSILLLSKPDDLNEGNQSEDDFLRHEFDLAEESRLAMRAQRNWRSCMQKELVSIINKFTKTWNTLEKISIACSKSTDLWHIEPSIIHGTVDPIYYLPPSNKTGGVILRLGIGGNISIENQLKLAFPSDTEFFGADPMYKDNAELFSSIGVYFPFAVGGQSAINRAVLRLASDNFARRQVIQIGLSTLIGNLMKKNHVDLLIIEGEGSEYKMLQEFGLEGSVTERGIAVCQINIELHRPARPGDPREKLFLQLLAKILEEGKYVIHTARNAGHYRLFLLDFYSPMCRTRFIEQYYSHTI